MKNKEKGAIIMLTGLGLMGISAINVNLYLFIFSIILVIFGRLFEFRKQSGESNE